MSCSISVLGTCNTSNENIIDFSIEQRKFSCWIKISRLSAASIFLFTQRIHKKCSGKFQYHCNIIYPIK